MEVQRYDLSAIKCNQALPSSNWIKGEDHDFIVSERDKLIDEMLDCIRKIHTYDYYQDFYHRVEAMRGGKG